HFGDQPELARTPGPDALHTGLTRLSRLCQKHHLSHRIQRGMIKVAEYRSLLHSRGGVTDPHHQAELAAFPGVNDVTAWLGIRMRGEQPCRERHFPLVIEPEMIRLRL